MIADAGNIIALLGVLVVFVGVVALNSDKIRSKLPVRAPKNLICYGGILFLVGVIVTAIGELV